MNIGICRLSLLYESIWFGSYHKVVLNHGLKENQKENNQHTHLSGNFFDLANHFSRSKCFKSALLLFHNLLAFIVACCFHVVFCITLL